ncbi:alpha/beta fold hydrolase [Stutzerimonas kirkiae]|uniref:Alpha/beta hydrolase n=1 Tax=Stutzerimonas kirkiae TaxID=2211392 RepID=A0A4Q9QX94_9GAMM|nr:alpha/beta hydrolase [Stutzerimonas kirkiae]TBU87991.1 alpha/beta hydrolase [Stutzerimonas kirkiae]TBU98191.1 alpha/beta hydrolase [Stutzerimonas kirkiae]TBV10507.1 alpha/beta hydrolase [Stutzerimonas kirkiae]
MAETDPHPIVHGPRLEVRPGRLLSLAHRPGSDPRGYTLFFAHGGGGNQDQWRELWRDPRLSGHNLVAWDLLGHGTSDRPRQAAAYAWDELVADQLAILRRFAGERNVLVAHSFGTALTLSALQRLPTEPARPAIDGVLLLGTQLQVPLRSDLLRLPAWVLELIRPLLAKGFRQAAWHPASDPELVAYEDALTRRNALHVFKALLNQGRWIPEDIGPLGARVRVLAGEADRVTPAEGAWALAERLQGEHFEVLSGAGHQLMLERPDAVLEHLLALLSERSG